MGHLVGVVQKALPPGYQETSGTVSSVVGKEVQLWFGVIAEDWPSWLFALDAVGIKLFQTVMPHASNQVVKEAKETRLGGSLVELTDGLSSLESVMSDREVVLIQGTEVFVDSMCSRLRSR